MKNCQSPASVSKIGDVSSFMQLLRLEDCACWFSVGSSRACGFGVPCVLRIMVTVTILDGPPYSLVRPLSGGLKTRMRQDLKFRKGLNSN